MKFYKFLSGNILVSVLAEEELLPYIANKDFYPEDIDLDSLLTDKTAGILLLDIIVFQFKTFFFCWESSWIFI